MAVLGERLRICGYFSRSFLREAEDMMIFRWQLGGRLRIGMYSGGSFSLTAGTDEGF